MDNLAYKLKPQNISNKYRTSLTDKVRVVFYGRVSTQHEAQVNALDNQLQWYDSILRDHPNWEKVNVYVDKGVTGTQARRRHGFMQMIEDAEKGMFDLICTREVSRFARNTLDSLAYTRQLKDMGVEVFFYNDNIWSCESDGELRLTIMSAMSQEESKHISDRVLAGQQISREKGVLYGNGNILGYRLVKGKTSVENTYEIVEDEAETVIMIFEMYLSGLGVKAIVSRLIALKRKKSNGGYKWQASYVTRLLDNKTYAGYIGYNKSYTKDFLAHSRVTIRDRTQYVYVKGNFPPIISEDVWNRVQALKRQKVINFGDKNRGKPMARDKWVKHLLCECGKTYKRYKWRTNQSGEECFGYQCRNQVDYRKRSYHEKNGLDGTGYCDIPSICEWKLDFMLKAILQRMWQNPNDTIENLVQDIQNNFVETTDEITSANETEKLKRELDRLVTRKNNLVEMRLDNLIQNEEYESKNAQIGERIREIEQTLSMTQEDESIECKTDVGQVVENIKAFLDEVCDLGQKQVSEEIVDALVERITPTEAGIFKWYIKNDDVGEVFDETQYVLCDRFTLGFEEAKQYRKSFGNFIRARQWRDINVEVYIKKE